MLKLKIYKLRYLTSILTIVLCLATFYSRVYATGTDTTNTTTTSTTTSESLVSYALKWADNQNILYEYGGSGRGKTLEDCDAQKLTTDCSGFVSSVYSHFGISIPITSAGMYSGAKKVFYDESQAVPGDVVWWDGHVGIYIGDSKLIHTNTSRPPVNYIHISSFADYRAPSAYLRMVDDVSAYGTDSLGASEQQQVEQQVALAVSKGSLVTESDLNGMPIESTLKEAQKRISLKSRDDLTQTDVFTLEYIDSCMQAQKVSTIDWYYTLLTFLGWLTVVYGVLMGVSYLFDYVNVFIDISLLSIISFGKWRMLNKYDVEDGLIKPGKNLNGITYLSTSGLVIRLVLVILIGIFLLSGKLGTIIANVVSYFI